MPNPASLQAALGAQYIIERELGGGGMSRVFVAKDTVLGRRIVVKVLAEELAVGVSIDRFRREIKVAAGLQHPHIRDVASTLAYAHNHGVIHRDINPTGAEETDAVIRRISATPPSSESVSHLTRATRSTTTLRDWSN